MSLVVSVDVKHHDYLQYAFLQSTLTGRKTPIYLLTYLLTFKVLFLRRFAHTMPAFHPRDSDILIVGWREFMEL